MYSYGFKYGFKNGSGEGAPNYKQLILDRNPLLYIDATDSDNTQSDKLISSITSLTNGYELTNSDTIYRKPTYGPWGDFGAMFFHNNYLEIPLTVSEAFKDTFSMSFIIRPQNPDGSISGGIGTSIFGMVDGTEYIILNYTDDGKFYFNMRNSSATVRWKSANQVYTTNHLGLGVFTITLDNSVKGAGGIKGYWNGVELSNDGGLYQGDTTGFEAGDSVNTTPCYYGAINRPASTTQYHDGTNGAFIIDESVITEDQMMDMVNLYSSPDTRSRYGIYQNVVKVIMISMSQSNGTGGSEDAFPDNLKGFQGGVYDLDYTSLGVRSIDLRTDWQKVHNLGFHDYALQQLVRKYRTAAVFLDCGESGTGFYYKPASIDWNILSTTSEGSLKDFNNRLLDRTVILYNTLKTQLEAVGYTLDIKLCSITGESDSGATPNADEFFDNYTDSKDFLESNLTDGLPEVIMVKVHNNFDPARVGNTTVRASQDALAVANPTFHYITNSDTFALSSDDVHYNNEGQSQMNDEIFPLL